MKKERSGAPSFSVTGQEGGVSLVPSKKASSKSVIRETGNGGRGEAEHHFLKGNKGKVVHKRLTEGEERRATKKARSKDKAAGDEGEQGEDTEQLRPAPSVDARTFHKGLRVRQAFLSLAMAPVELNHHPLFCFYFPCCREGDGGALLAKTNPWMMEALFKVDIKRCRMYLIFE